MSRLIFLDSGPLGLLTHPQRSREVIEITQWFERCLRSGCQFIVPSIVYYEIRRELLRANKTQSLSLLDAFVNITPWRYLPLTDAALRLAAELWAKSRQQGVPTADAAALDIDIILAAQAQLFAGDEKFVIVTSNERHLRRFTDARNWAEIVPSKPVD